MSKKKLLEESTVRSFMKLANLAPLSDRFIKEEWQKKEESLNEESDEEEGQKHDDKGDKKEEDDELDEQRYVSDRDDDPSAKDRLEEEELEEGEVTEEGKESEGRASSPRPKVKGVQKPGKMAAAKNAPGDAKMKPMKQTHVHSDKPDSIEHKQKSNAPKKNNSQFEIVSESLEEEMEEVEDMPPESGETPSDAAGETEEHQDTVKDALKKMLGAMQQIASEYGVDMNVSSDMEIGRAHV